MSLKDYIWRWDLPRVANQISTMCKIEFLKNTKIWHEQLWLKVLQLQCMSLKTCVRPPVIISSLLGSALNWMTHWLTGICSSTILFLVDQYQIQREKSMYSSQKTQYLELGHKIIWDKNDSKSMIMFSSVQLLAVVCVQVWSSEADVCMTPVSLSDRARS